MKNYYFLITLYCFLSIRAYSQSGTLDYSFGDSGIVYNSIIASANASAMQQDEKILYGGLSAIYQYYLARHFNDGTLDSSFGKNGIANIQSLTTLAGIKVMNDGSILTGGNSIGDVAAALFKTDGTLDSSFGVNGYSVADYGKLEFANAMSLQPDGKILLAGNQYTMNVSRFMLIVRLNQDGTKDKSFGNNGQVVNTSGIDINSMDIQPDGKIITAGHTSNGGPSDNFVINRYNSDGSNDKTFGSNGLVVTSFENSTNVPYSVKVLQDGKFLVAGVAAPGTGSHSYMAIAKYNSDGSLDKTFGNNGKSIIDFGEKSGVARNILIQKDNKIVLTGFASDCYGCGNEDLALTRTGESGILDSSFALDGIQVTDFGANEYSRTSLLQDDSKILLIGEEGNTARIILARYNNEISQKQLIITKIRNWLQHHNGFIWDANSSISSYAVQRSYDGVHFNSIARIHAGNSSKYTYQDPMPLSGNNYYRLQTTSADGSVNYSNVIAATANTDAIKISPNPAKNTLRIEGLPSNQKIKISVVDFSGFTALSLSPSTFSLNYSLNIASLKPGNYLLKIEMDGEVLSKKFVKE